jgi:hypothetical protein
MPLSCGAKTAIPSVFLAGIRCSQDDAIGGKALCAQKCRIFAKGAAIFKRRA